MRNRIKRGRTKRRKLALDKQEIWAAMLRHEVKYSYDGRYSQTYPYGVVQRIAQGPVDPRGVRPWRCRLIARDVANVAVVHLSHTVNAACLLKIPPKCFVHFAHSINVCHRISRIIPRGQAHVRLVCRNRPAASSTFQPQNRRC